MSILGHGHRCLVVIAVLAVATLAATPAAGQQGLGFELSLSNPGARSLGFGGAFVALADDATAAFANPAGLVQLIEPEVSIEGRSWRYSTPGFDRGRFEGQPTGIGLDTEPGLHVARSQADLEGLSFLSFVYPMRRWSLAAYRHQLAKFELSGETQGFFGDGSEFAGAQRLAIIRAAIDLDVVTHGVAAGFKVSERLSLGLGLSYYDVTQRVDQEVSSWDEDTQESFFGEIHYLPERLRLSSARLAEDGDWGLAAGFLWRLNERWSLGGSARTGPEVDEDAVLRAGPEIERLFPGTPPDAVVAFSVPQAFPDVYGLGVAFRSAGGRLTASFEWDRVEYSDLLDNDPDENESIPDADELHLGFELAFPGSTPLFALRLGAWLDPEHLIEPVGGDIFTPFAGALGGDEIHYSAGLGMVVQSLQVDLAADFSDSRDTLSFSAIYRF